MRRSLLLVALVLVGCKPGRQAAVSNAGRVASTAEGGTYVAGVGKVGPEATDVAWSPDGQTLAFSLKDGVWLWPSGERLTGMSGPLAFSPDGGRLAGVVEGRVTIKSLLTGGAKATTLAENAQGLRWTSDERLLAFIGRQVAIDGGPTLAMKEGDLLDVRPAADGTLGILTVEPEQAPGADPREATLVRWRWNPATGALVRVASDRFADLASNVPGRLELPHRYALSQDGGRIVVALLRLETTPARLSRLTKLGMKEDPTRAEMDEVEAITRSARLSNVVETIREDGHAVVLWCAPAEDYRSLTDLELSSDGRWVAIAGREGTVRVGVER